MAVPDTAGATLTIDLDAVAANYRILRDCLGGALCAAVVKADAYGLGAVPVARRLAREGCRSFFVARLGEGLSLRTALNEAGIEASIYILDGLVPGAEADYIEHLLIPVLNQTPEIDAWAAAGRVREKALPALLHIDTGMARLGMAPDDATSLAAAPDRLRGIGLQYVMSHLACANDRDHPMNREQRDRFCDFLTLFPGIAGSLANSSGVFLGPDFHFAMARPGSALYGIQPFDAESKPMRQVINLQGKILQCRFVDTGQTVGYGATHRFGRRSRIATVGLGYADGFLRSLGNRASGYVGEIRVPVVGRISMDLITFDVTDVPESACRPGASIELIGPHHSPDDLAAEGGTIGYEILTSLGTRYSRRYVGG